ncbi:MAG: NrsF family protein [Pseudomonadota bacterium]
MRDSQTMNANSTLIDGLTESLMPVARRRPSREIAILGLIALIQLAGTLSLLGDNAVAVFSKDMVGVGSKALMLGAGALAFFTLTLRGFEPTTSRQSKIAMVVGALILGFGVLTLDRNFGGSMQSMLMPEKGIVCLASSISFALPMFMALTFFMRGAATTQPQMTALLIGIASGTWGVFVYGLQCPFTNLAYLAVWYGGAVALVSLAAAVILPRAARW